MLRRRSEDEGELAQAPLERDTPDTSALRERSQQDSTEQRRSTLRSYKKGRMAAGASSQAHAGSRQLISRVLARGKLAQEIGQCV